MKDRFFRFKSSFWFIMIYLTLHYDVIMMKLKVLQTKSLTDCCLLVLE